MEYSLFTEIPFPILPDAVFPSHLTFKDQGTLSTLVFPSHLTFKDQGTLSTLLLLFFKL